jgi:hypothetical protein
MTKKINSVEEALNLFEQSTLQHTIATETGDYKSGNKAYKSILNSIVYLNQNNKVELLVPFVNHSNNGVRVWAASYLLNSNTGLAVKILEEISVGLGIISYNAQMTLSEWRKGNLKMQGLNESN